MPNKKSIQSGVILDRLKMAGTWDQVIAEAELQIARLRESIRVFRQQKKSGVPYPDGERSGGLR